MKPSSGSCTTSTPPDEIGAYGPGWEYYLDNLVAARAGAKLPTFDEYYPSMQGHYTDG